MKPIYLSPDLQPYPELVHSKRVGEAPGLLLTILDVFLTLLAPARRAVHLSLARNSQVELLQERSMQSCALVARVSEAHASSTQVCHDCSGGQDLTLLRNLLQRITPGTSNSSSDFYSRLGRSSPSGSSLICSRQCPPLSSCPLPVSPCQASKVQLCGCCMHNPDGELTVHLQRRRVATAARLP